MQHRWRCFNLIYICLLCFLCRPLAQPSQIEQLRSNANNAANGQPKLRALLDFCTRWDSYSPDTLYAYASKAKALAVELKDQRALLLADYYLAAFLFQQNKLDTAQSKCVQVFSAYSKLYPYDSVFTMLYRLETNIYLRKEQYDSAQSKDIELIKLGELHKDTAAIIIGTIGLGNVNNKLQKKEEAIYWYSSVLKLMTNDICRKKFPFVYNNMAIVYYKKGMEDSMFYFIKTGLKYSEESGNGTDYANALFLYGGMLSEFGRTTEAETAFKKGIEQRKQIGDIYYLLSDMAQFALFYLNTKQPQKGIALCTDGIAIAKKNNYPVLQDLYQSLQRSYQLAGDYKNAANTLETLLAVKDSVYEKNSADAMAEMQTKFEVQKKENTIIQQRYDLATKNFFIYGVTVLLIAALLFGYFFFQNRKKNQRLKLQALEMEEKKKITAAVMKAEEEERKRIAADLHDSVAQKMVVAKLNLEVFGNHAVDMNASQQKVYRNIYQLLEESTAEVRNLSHSMMPQAFAKAGLVKALEDFFEKTETPGLKISFMSTGDFTGVPDNAALMIYRVIQEVVQNALKHAKATRLDISMAYANNELEVTVEDNGVGFDPGAIDVSASNGIKNIYSRVEYLNGKIEISSQDGHGTVVAFYVPL